MDREREDSIGWVTLPYIKGTTEPLKRTLESYNFKVAMKPSSTLRNNFMRPKDRVPTCKETSYMIYHVRIVAHIT